MELTKTYQKISTISVTYGEIRTYARYTSQDSGDNTTSYQIKQTYYVPTQIYVGVDNATGTLDGTQKKYTSYTRFYKGETTIQELNRVIEHNQDGSSPTKSVATSWTASFGGGGNTSANITFPNITRMSIPTINTPKVNSPNFNIEDIITIYTNRPVSTYTHTLYINYGNSTLKLAENITDSVQIETNLIKNYLYSQIPNSNSYTNTFTLETYDGETLVGSANCQYIANVVDSNPTFDVAYKDVGGTTTALTQDNQQIVQALSYLQVNITNATALNSATLSSVSININGTITTDSISSSSKDVNIGTVDIAQNTNATVTLTDSRGNTTTKTLAITVLAWEQPSAIITLNRKQNFYTETDINVDANYSSLDNKNTITIEYRKKKESDVNYDSWTSLTDGTTTTFNADNTYAWNIQVRVIDGLGATTTYNLSIGVGLPIFFIDRYLRSLGVNCFPAGNGTIEIDGTKVELPYVLYEDNTGTQGDVTLSDTLANYEYIDIIGMQGSCYSTTRIYNPNGIEFSISFRNMYDSTHIHNVVKNYQGNGNKIEVLRGAYSVDTVGGTLGTIGASTSIINIKKVVGYK